MSTAAQLLLEIPFHNIDPVAVDFGFLPLRWYGLGYLISFVASYFILKKLWKGGYLKITLDDISSLLMFAIVGTFIGGRMGELFFYSDILWGGRFLDDPGLLIGIEPGQGFNGIKGLSFHGGLMGVILAGTLFCWLKAKAEWRVLNDEERGEEGKHGLAKRTLAKVGEVFDSCVLAAPLGIFVVRCMNFVNGELYGRLIRDSDGNPTANADEAPAWAMRFPSTIEQPDLTGIDPFTVDMAREQTIQHSFGGPGGGAYEIAKEMFQMPSQGGNNAIRQEIERVRAVIERHGGAGTSSPTEYSDAWEAAQQHVFLRHPSQIYQGLCEGLIVLGILWLMRKRFKKKGMLGGLFLIGYGLARYAMEFFREPDHSFDEGGKLEGWGAVLDSIAMTQGQFLCACMVVAGAIIMFFAKRAKADVFCRSPEDLLLRGEPFQPVVDAE